MKTKKRTGLLTLVLAIGLLCGSVIPIIAIATAGEEEQPPASTTAPYTVEYEKPSIGEIVGDGAYPAEKDSSASSAAAEKEWYEYITYSKEPIGYYEIPSVSFARALCVLRPVRLFLWPCDGGRSASWRRFYNRKSI